jgi:hypothetical protein
VLERCTADAVQHATIQRLLMSPSGCVGTKEVASRDHPDGAMAVFGAHVLHDLSAQPHDQGPKVLMIKLAAFGRVRASERVFT